ncbi:kinase-like domain-containing protein [Obelidium mucronatum]|nr:kinase-like domain-containing protein [Obelidium mucronatum]
MSKPAGSSISGCTSPIPLSPQLSLPSNHGHRHHKVLYSGLTSEAKARISIVQAFNHSASHLIDCYSIKKIIGFGSNGVVLAALTTSGLPCAIKIIYKLRPSVHTPIPPEISVLKLLATNGKHTLRYLEDWEDVNHFYLVTELFGSDWHTHSHGAPKLAPVHFQAIHNGSLYDFTFPISNGTSDLWSWGYAHRYHAFRSEGHCFLPIEPVKQIVHQIALALFEMHQLNLFHGDIKLENVLVQQGGPLGPQVRLADFGHANHISFGIHSYGTAEVSACEFLPDSPYADQKLDGRAADVFALGMVLYLLLTPQGVIPTTIRQVMAGKVGYDALLNYDHGEFPLDDIPDLDDEAWDLLAAMTCVDPVARIPIEMVLQHPFFADA